MKAIAKFYTIFWMIYFPLCIAYYDVGPTLWVDEIMTFILIGYTITKWNKKYIVKNPINEFKQYALILSFFVIYGLIFGENVKEAVWRDLIQWIRPFSVIYCTWILNPRFSERQKSYMLYGMLATMASWIVYHPQVTSSNNAEYVVLGQLAMCTGMAWYLFRKESKRNTYIALLLVLMGFLAPKIKYIGEVTCFIYMIFFMKSKLKFNSPKTFFSIFVLISLVLIISWSKVDAYFVEGMNATGYDRLARPESYKTAVKLLFDYFPFGPGMGSFAVAAAADFYSPIYYKYELNNIWGLAPSMPFFIADAFYPALANFGVVGIFFFIIFWKRRLISFNKIIDLRYYRVVWISFFCLAIEQTADSSFLSGKGMGYCMLLALCLNANRNLGDNSTTADVSSSKPIRMHTTFGLRHRKRRILKKL